MLKGRAQKIGGIAHCNEEPIHRKPFLNSFLQDGDRLPLCIQSSGPAPKLRCTLLPNKKVCFIQRVKLRNLWPRSTWEREQLRSPTRAALPRVG